MVTEAKVKEVVKVCEILTIDFDHHFGLKRYIIRISQYHRPTPSMML